MDLTRSVLARISKAGLRKEHKRGAGSGEGVTRRARSRRLLLVAAAVVIAVAPFLPFVDDYWIDIGFYFGIYTLLGLSLNIVLGEVGLFDLGHMGFYAIGAYTTAILNTMLHIPIALLLPISAVAAGLFAWIVTAPVIHLKGDYLCIVTIGIGEIVRLTMINNPFGLTGGPNGVNGIDCPVIFIPIVSSRQFYYLVWALIAVAIFALLRLQRSRIGRAWNYIREDETAAESLGVDVRHYKLAAFILGAALAGLTGTLYASKQMSVSPESFTFMESSLLFCIVLLGGLGSIPGTVLGALAITIFPELFRPLAQYRLMFFGLALLIMMIFRPAGLMPRQRESSEELHRALSKQRKKDNPFPAEEHPSSPRDDAHQRPVAPQTGALLELKNVRLSFGGVTAVAGVDARIEAGKITALIGPNGAGKTTLFNLITGIYRPEGGRILFKGRNIAGLPPHTIAAQGIARTFQNIRIFPSLTCLENVLCGQHCRGRAEFTGSLLHLPSQCEEEKRMLDFSLRCLERVGLGETIDKIAAGLPYGKRRSLEIARALALRPDLLVLDEPSSGLNDAETEELAELLKSLLYEGLSILLIEHDMHLVEVVSDHVIVMQSGRIIAEGKMCDMRKNPLVIEAYLGTDED